MTKIFVTKYALTQGIFTIDAEILNDGDMARYRTEKCMFDSYVHGNDFHLSQTMAIARAEQMRKAKLASMDKARIKLNGRNFAEIRAVV